MLLVLVGLRGAGKTTLIQNLNRLDVEILQPSTTRPRRSLEENEYDFVEGDWDDRLYAWTIDVNGQKYGMRETEVSKAKNSRCVTVFDPLSLPIFEAKRRAFPFQTLTVGLDTIYCIEQQRERVRNDVSRTTNESDFTSARKTVSECDVVLSGDNEKILQAFAACLSILSARGGIITKDLITPLIAAGSLLADADPKNIRSASYDLRLGNEIWCQGELHQLDEFENPRFEIPAYSYAIVSAYENARLPPFLVGRFDLRVQYFFDGIILSNGPQVDPGYKGALFCMLYNASGHRKLLRFRGHFATIDFTTTTSVTEGYKQQYQFEERMERFMTDQTIVSKGGEIVDLIDGKVEVVDKKVRGIKASFWAIAGACITLVLAFPAITLPVILYEVSATKEATAELKSSLDELRAMQRKYDSELQSEKTPAAEYRTRIRSNYADKH